MEWAQVLVIILSVFLALFLLLSIVLIALLIKVTRQIKSITQSAERTVGNVEKVANNFTAATSPAVIAKVVSTFVKSFKK